MNKERTIRLKLDRLATEHGRRQASDLFDRYVGPDIPSPMIAAARDAFIEAARRAVADAGVPGDISGIVQQLLDLRDSAFSVELRRRARSGGQ